MQHITPHSQLVTCSQRPISPPNPNNQIVPSKFTNTLPLKIIQDIPIPTKNQPVQPRAYSHQSLQPQQRFQYFHEHSYPYIPRPIPYVVPAIYGHPLPVLYLVYHY